MKTILKRALRPLLIRPLPLRLLSCSLLSSVSLTATPNVAPTVTIVSAAMRPGTTLMDVVYRVTDPDDATVKVRALAFKDGVRSFANVIRPVTWAEGTAANIGDAITTNVDHTLTWDVAADWNIQLGQVKMEVQAVDSNGMLPFDGISIPAAAGQPELTINRIGLTDPQVFNPLLWFYASGNLNMELTNGTLLGSAPSGVFNQRPVVVGATIDQQFAQLFLFKLLDISPATTAQLNYTDAATRTTLARDRWFTTNRSYVGTQLLISWGQNNLGQTNIPPELFHCVVTAIAAGQAHSLALKDNGTVVAWGDNSYGRTSVPVGLSGVIAIAAGNCTSLALKNDGTVVGWGYNVEGQATPPAGLSGVTIISAGDAHTLALKNDGTVVAWGYNSDGQCNIPAGLSGVTAIAAGRYYSLALKNDGTVVGWGRNNRGQTDMPVGLSGVRAIAAGTTHALALKNDGTVVGWGDNDCGQTTIPAGLTNVTAITAGGVEDKGFSLALKNNGTVVAWGTDDYGQTTVPSGLAGVITIAAGYSNHCIAVAKAP